MARRPIPKVVPSAISKQQILQMLEAVDADAASWERIRNLETRLRARIDSHLKSLPTNGSTLRDFKTNPFVLLMYCKQQGYTDVCEIEHDIVPAKVFSSMETSAGKMIEDEALPVYGWTKSVTAMHTAESVIDGYKVEGGTLNVATLKSGPSCLNDEMSRDIGHDIVNNVDAWAHGRGVKRVDVSYGVLYGTNKQSNKKDWHILRNAVELMHSLIEQRHAEGVITLSHEDRWSCEFVKNGVTVKVTVRVGAHWWEHIGGGPHTLIELGVALIRACVAASAAHTVRQCQIADIERITSIAAIGDFNIRCLQRNQIAWMFFFLAHFFDEIQG